MRALTPYDEPETPFVGCLYRAHRGVFVREPAGWCLLLNDNGQQTVLTDYQHDTDLKSTVIHYRQDYHGMTIVIEFKTLEEQFQWFAAGE